MKIAHFISAPASGGVEVFIKDLSISLTKSGVSVVIIFLSTAKDAGRDESFERKYLQELHSHGVDYFFIGNECRKNIIKGVYRLNKVIRDSNIDVLHSHMPYGVLFSLFKTVPLIYTHHSIEARLNKTTYFLFNLIIDKYVGISDACSESLKKSIGESVTTIRNSVDINKFNNFNRLRSKADQYTILMVGRISEQKDYLTMIEAISKLPKRILDIIEVKVAGEGKEQYKAKLLELISEKKLEHKIKFIGNQSNIPKLMYEADFFMMSSRWEGLPIALIESVVSGLPSVVTNVGGCAEVVNQYNCGISVEPSNPDMLSRALVELVDNEKLITELSSNALKNSQEFNVEINKKKHIELYQALTK